MEYLVTHFAGFSDLYMKILIQLTMVLTMVLFGYWLYPFVSRKRATYATALLYGLLVSINTYIDLPKNVHRIIAIGIIVVSILAVWLLDERRNLIQKIYLCLVFRLVSWLVLELFSEIGFYERDLVWKLDWYAYYVEVAVVEFIIWNMIQYVFSMFLLLWLIRKMHRIYVRKADELTWQEFGILSVPVCTLLIVKPIISSYFYLWMEGMENGSINENIPANPYRILFCVLSFFPVIIVLALYQKLKEEQEKLIIQESVGKQIGLTHRYVDHIEELYEKMRAMRHDMANHMTIIEGLAQGGKNQELSEYVSEMQKRFYEIQPSIKTGNAVTDVVLSEVCDTCEKEQIRFESKFVYPDDLQINPFDMSVILTNALQNAIEASGKIPSAKVTITSVTKERMFIISVKNLAESKVIINEEGLIESTKQDAGHGYGLKNIRSIAQKYRGDIEIRQDDSEGRIVFVLNVMLMG